MFFTMGSLRIFSVPLMACIFSNSSKKCPRNSESRVSKTQAIQDYFRDHSIGITGKVVKPMDPMNIDNVEVSETLSSVKSHLTNTKVTGFKDVVVTQILEEKDSDTVHYTLKFKMAAEGPVSIEFPKRNLTLTGSVKYEGGATGHISHTCTPKSVNGQNVFEVGPETITCEFDDVKSSLTQLTAPHGNEILKAEYEKVKMEHQNKVMCEIAAVVFRRAVENLRILGTI